MAVLLGAGQGQIFTAGFGSTGREVLESIVPEVIPELEEERITDIRAGWGVAAAFSRNTSELDLSVRSAERCLSVDRNPQTSSLYGA